MLLNVIAATDAFAIMQTTYLATPFLQAGARWPNKQPSKCTLQAAILADGNAIARSVYLFAAASVVNQTQQRYKNEDRGDFKQGSAWQ